MGFLSKLSNSAIIPDEDLEVFSSCKRNKPVRPPSNNDLALVQNFSVSGVAQSSCPAKIKEQRE